MALDGRGEGRQVTSVTLHLGDCLEYMRTMADKSVDAVITDPPYPGLKGGLKYKTTSGVSLNSEETITVGTPWGEELDALLEVRRVAKYGAIVFCSWHSVGQVRDLLGGEAVGLVTWYKRNSQQSFRNRPHYMCEYAWLIEYAPGMNWKPIKTFYDIAGLPAGCFSTERVLTKGTQQAAHPSQKPVQLMRMLVQAVPQSVLDPYCGTGTTGVACLDLGKDFVGVEIDPAYFAIAEKRIAEAQMQLPLLEGI